MLLQTWKRLSKSVQWDGQTDTTKLIVAFRNFAKAPKNQNSYPTENTILLHYKTRIARTVQGNSRTLQCENHTKTHDTVCAKLRTGKYSHHWALNCENFYPSSCTVLNALTQ